MSLTLREVLTRRTLDLFINFPLKLYRYDPYYVPSLFSDEINTLHWDKNPAFENCEARYWLVYEDNEVVGRVAGIINYPHIKKWKESYIRFGWLDFIDDKRVSTMLLEAVESWAREKGLTAVHGPLGFTDLDREGMLIEGFNELATLATMYNYPYYLEHLTQLGYVKDIDWIEYQLSVPEKLDEKITRAADIVLRRNNLHLLEVENKKELLSYGYDLFHLLIQEYGQLYGATPLTDDQIKHYIQAYFGFVHPDFIPIVVDKNEEMVAFGITIPSLSRALQKSRGRLFPLGWFYILHALQKNDTADLYLIAVKKRYQGLGVNMVLMNQVCQVFNKRGIGIVETNPELETNTNVQSQWKFLAKRQHKRRRCFIKKL